MSTLLILGAGTDQIYPIKLAKQLGLRVLTRYRPNAPGFLCTDEVAVNRDLGGLKALCDSSLNVVTQLTECWLWVWIYRTSQPNYQIIFVFLVPQLRLED